MSLSYQRVNWTDYPATTTPISAENLNVMDEGIENLTTEINSVESDISEINSSLSELKKNSYGGEVDLKTYTSSSPYTAPCDGYILIKADGTNPSVIAVIGYGSGQFALISARYTSGDPLSFYNSIFVRKGMKIYPYASYSGTSYVVFKKIV